MKKLLFAGLALLQGIVVTESIAQVSKAAPLQQPHEKKAFVCTPEQAPVFRNGTMQDLTSYIQQHVRYPLVCDGIDKMPKGRVFISFKVDEKGIVRDARIVKGLHPLFDAEALRVVQALEGFAPGTQNGQPIEMTLSVPITF